MFDPKEDANHFGENAWIYCDSHMRPHTTGWCTVPVRDKIKLDSTNYEDAQAECRAKGYELYVDLEAKRRVKDNSNGN